MAQILWKVYILLALFCTFNNLNAQMCTKPKNLANYKSNKLNVLIKMQPPFITFDSKLNCLDGIDIRILKVFADRMKLDIAFETIDDTRNIDELDLE